MKKIVSLFLCAVLLMGSVAAWAEQDKLYNAGTYTAVVSAHNGEMTVEVVFDATSIVSVNITAHSESPAISDKAIETIPAAIVEHQTLAVDTIAGATVSSKAIIKAVEEAVSAAGGDISLLQKQVEKAAKMEAEEVYTDVVVVGAGAAGLITTYRLAQLGHDVALIEKMPYAGGATNTCGGGMAVTGSTEQKALGKDDDPEKHLYNLVESGEHLSDPAVSRVFAYGTGPAIDYLQSIGIEVNITESAYGSEYYGVYSVSGGGAKLIQEMEARIEQQGKVDYRLNTDAQELLTDESGAVIGVKAIADGQTEVKIYGKAVVLATGGYSANDEMLDTIYYPEAINSGVAYLDGDGILMAQQVGAAVDHLEWINPNPSGIATSKDDGVYFSTQSSITSTTGSIIVNQYGKRVMNEETAALAQVEVYGAQDNHMLYLVMDQAGFEMLRASGSNFGHVFFTADDVDRWLAEDSLYPILVKGETAQAAGEAAGIDGAALQATVDHYNEMVVAGEDTEFGHKISTKIEGPVYVLEMRLRYSKTTGGLSSNDKLQILDTQGNPIPNLYGAGEVNSGSAMGSSSNGLLAWCVASAHYLANELDAQLK